MAMTAERVWVNRVENGWVLTVESAGTNLMLVAKTLDEVAGFIKGIDWRTPRPLPPDPYGTSTQPEICQAARP